MVPSLIAVGTYALLLAWNEYLYAFLLLSRETALTLPVALGNFLSADDSPWELLMTAGFIYALPPAAIYYAVPQVHVVRPHRRRGQGLSSAERSQRVAMKAFSRGAHLAASRPEAEWPKSLSISK